jgi:putative transposase
MANDNPAWGEQRIANELLVKLGMRVSPRTVRKYMPKRPPGGSRGDQRWSTFLSNHAKAIIACDFFVAVTATFDRCTSSCSPIMHRGNCCTST